MVAWIRFLQDFMNDLLKYEGQKLCTIFQMTIVNATHEISHFTNSYYNDRHIIVDIGTLVVDAYDSLSPLTTGKENLSLCNSGPLLGNQIMYQNLLFIFGSA